MIVLELVAVLQLGFQLFVLVHQRLAFDGFFELVEQPIGVHRLFEKVEGTRLDRLDRSRDVPLPGDDDDLGLWIELLESADQLDAIDVRKHHVGDDGIGAPGLEDLLAARPDEGGPHLEARVLQQDLQPFRHRRLVIDGEHALLPFQTHEGSVCIEFAN